MAAKGTLSDRSFLFRLPYKHLHEKGFSLPFETIYAIRGNGRTLQLYLSSYFLYHVEPLASHLFVAVSRRLAQDVFAHCGKPHLVVCQSQ